MDCTHVPLFTCALRILHSNSYMSALLYIIGRSIVITNTHNTMDTVHIISKSAMAKYTVLYINFTIVSQTYILGSPV